MAAVHDKHNLIERFALGRVPKPPVSQVLRDETAQIGEIVTTPRACPLDEKQNRQDARRSRKTSQEVWGHALELLLNLIMRTERSHAIQAEPYERSEARRGDANGFKDKTLQTRIGELKLKVPKVRGMEFYPQSFEKGSSLERALKLAIAEMYIKGVSTRKVKSVLNELCGTDISCTQVSRATQLLDEELDAFCDAPLSDMPYIGSNKIVSVNWAGPGSLD